MKYKELIKILEGYEKKVYEDTEGLRTIGYGFNMDDSIAKRIWNELDIEEGFEDIYEGKIEISDKSAEKLLESYWDNAARLARKRARELNVAWYALPEWHQFILTDIAYNTGSVSSWKKVFEKIDATDVVYEARRIPKQVMDNRVCKIAKWFGIYDTVEDCIEGGLEYARYNR